MRSIIVSVPLSGLLFLNTFKPDSSGCGSGCFRPLIGVIISKHLLIIMGLYMVDTFPSPYRGYYF